MGDEQLMNGICLILCLLIEFFESKVLNFVNSLEVCLNLR
jgi:hypothetical protein